MQTTPSTVPFVEYVLKVIEHPPHMFVSKLAACCTTLFLTRSDPHLLRSLCHKWAIRFAMDRKKLIRYIKERSRQVPGKPNYCTGSDAFSDSSSDDEDEDEDENCDPSVAAEPKPQEGGKTEHGRAHLKFCDPEKAEEHFLSILNSLVPLYFSWNWHRTEHVIKMNKEHELYIRENVLPICIAVPAEDGLDDDEALPWLCPPRSFLRGCSEVGISGSPTQSISQFYMGPVNEHSGRGDVTRGRSARLSPLDSEGSRAGDGATVSPVRSPTAPTASNTAATHGLMPGTQNSASDRSPGSLPSITQRHGPGAHLVQAPTIYTANVAATSPSAGLTLMTLSNYKAILTSNPNGTVMIFHAEYSMKSNDLLQLMQDVVQKQLLDPMPAVAVVYTVTEPELSALYEIQWIPTIIFTPATTESAFDAAKSLISTSSDPTASRVEPHTPNSGGPMQDACTPRRRGQATQSSHGLLSPDGTLVNGAQRSPTAMSSLSAGRSATPTTDDTHRDAKSGAGSTRTPGLSSTIARTNSVDCGVSTRSVTASTNAATTAAAQLLYGLDLDRRRRKQGGGGGGGSPSEQTFASPVSNSGRNFDMSRGAGANEMGFATPMSTLDSLDHLGHDSLAGTATPVDELMSFVETDGHHVYPVNGLTTSSALVEWINSRGTSAPRLKKAKEFVTRVAAIRTEQKFKQFRELHSAVVMLRRLQSNDLSPSGAATHNEPPLFIFLGGGMAAGKSTAAMALAHSPWWRHHKDSSVLVNADEFKVADPLYETQHPDVHARSTRAAENLLVQAVNQGRSIVFDGTMMWKPFVEQVVSMVRNAHTTLYRQGPGYVPEKNIEEYFQVSKKRPSPLCAPYKLILLGITVEPEIAVPRGFLRKFSTGRGVPISTQLKSLKYFAQNFDDYIALVDRATLYNNNVFVDLSKGELPPVLAEMVDETPRKLHVFDESAYQLFLKQRTVNTDADNILELYPTSGSSVF